MVHRRPVRRSAAHRDATQDQPLAGRGNAANAIGDDDCRRGQDKLEAVLELTLGVKKEHVLCAGANVDGQNLHVVAIVLGQPITDPLRMAPYRPATSTMAPMASLLAA